MRTVLKSFLVLVFTFCCSPSTSSAVPRSADLTDNQIDCNTAIYTTLQHYAIGDGKNLGCDVHYEGGDLENDVPHAGALSCLASTGVRVTCWMAGEYCPKEDPDVDNPHDMEGPGRCSGCTDGQGNPAPNDLSVSEVKCCLLSGKISDPSCN